MGVGGRCGLVPLRWGLCLRVASSLVSAPVPLSFSAARWGGAGACVLLGLLPVLGAGGGWWLVC